MQDIWIAIGTTIALVAIIVPLAAVILVSLASVSEEAAHSLSGQAPGSTERAARRLLGFQSDTAGEPAARPERESEQGSDREVRFAHARRTLSDLSQ